MSGHSKWATIKRAKGAADVRRGATFTKLSNAITLAVKQGGGVGDPAQNFRLRLAVDAAKTSNMPKETIERAITRASGREAQDIQELTYEGFAPGGVAVIVEAATDNVNRTSGEIKGIFNKAGASFGQPGTVSYLFQLLGFIVIEKGNKSLDDIFLLAAESGAQDIEDIGDSQVAIYTKTEDINKVRENLISGGIKVVSVEFLRKPTNFVELDEEQGLKVIDFLTSLESLDDVQKVYSNIIA